jgi:hypothetical protein
MFLNDQETATDLLYYEAIAKTVVNLIRKTPDAPVTIGVHGDWGAGKSSVLKMLEGAFADDDRVLCLWFNGWTFEGFEDAKTVVIETIVDELRRARPMRSGRMDGEHAACRYGHSARALLPRRNDRLLECGAAPLADENIAVFAIARQLVLSSPSIAAASFDTSRWHCARGRRDNQRVERTDRRGPIANLAT